MTIQSKPFVPKQQEPQPRFEPDFVPEYGLEDYGFGGHGDYDDYGDEFDMDYYAET